MMVHRNCWMDCCHPDPHRAVRSREKRDLLRWRDEYEDPAEVEQRACPKGGPDCGCHHYSDNEVPPSGGYTTGPGEPPAMKLARVWDKDFQLLHTLEPNESYTQLPMDHPVARMLLDEDTNAPVFVTVDDVDEDEQTATRWSGRLAGHSVIRADGGDKVLVVDWVDEPPAHLVDFRNPYDKAKDSVPVRGVPDCCDIEIIERTRSTDREGAGGIVVPNEVRINGKPVMVPRDEPIILHEVNLNASEPVKVTLTLFARVVDIRHEVDDAA